MDDKRKEDYFNNVFNNIKNNGYHTTAVLEEIDFTPFAYSTGIFKNFKIPELFISGLGPNLSGELIENYVSKFKFSQVPLNRKIQNLSDRFAVYFISLKNSAIAEYALTSVKFYENRNYEYLQLIFPDLNGKFPNEVGYNYDQKVLGDLK
ncbi:DUF4262 domain-containing protein [Mucilaginibacter ginsenosidivorans]|uniref:DUF4262 domain-containing protein n=1 Tax=Mucilaginibacter ginsenosidivorans TaxID=398053 RepID=A0A5B8V0S7_9SPHI|nr:DUF4262 domain-containing protein [Mucilaginibacter ginsenosidivorans]QEC64645.1 DUF4262 domain-containing protein [Mucilaginibacter ginsenosidivorans]